jgi:hypothetical protein
VENKACTQPEGRDYCSFCHRLCCVHVHGSVCSSQQLRASLSYIHKWQLGSGES